MPPPKPVTARRPEHWSVDARDAEVATLTVPAALGRERVFEIDLRFVVRTPPETVGAWLSVLFELDGAREWTRRVDAQCPGHTDSLDFHCRRSLPEGRALRLRVTTQVGGGARRQSLRLDAEEVQRDDA